jgi:spore coat protein U-like protein
MLKPLVFATIALLCAAESHAASSSSNLVQSASVSGSCVINVGTTIAFGKYDPVGANKDFAIYSPTVPVSFRCTQGMSMPVISFGQGSSFDSAGCPTYNPRRLSNGAGVFLRYALYAGRFPSGSGANAQMPSACGTSYPASQMNAALNSGYDPSTNKSTEDVVFYLRGSISSTTGVPSHNLARAGNYTDSVTASITF